MKTPWGRNGVEQAGVRLDEHAQPGTGSTDAFGTLTFLYLVDRDVAVFASSGHRRTGRNAFGYRYGNSFLSNVAYEHKLGGASDGVVELSFRHAAEDVLDALGTKDTDTGGSLLYVTARVLASLGHGLVLRAAVLVPLLRGLNGFQKERAVPNLGLSCILRR